MASRAYHVVLAAILVITILCTGASAQSSSSCTSALVTLSPCLNYITGNESTPSSSCCSQLGTVVRSEPQCLCTFVNGGASSSLGITINQTQALALPSACKIQTAPASRCNGNGSGPTGSPSVPKSPSGDGSKTTPTVDSSHGNSAQIPFGLLSILFIMVYHLAPSTSSF